MINNRDAIKEIAQDKNLLLDKLLCHGSTKAKEKDKYSCAFCSSSNALGVYHTAGGYKYKCFSCGEQGDVFALEMHKRGKTFNEVLIEIAQEKGLEVNVRAHRGKLSKEEKEAREKRLKEEREYKEIKQFYIDEILKQKETDLIEDSSVDIEEVFKIADDIKEVQKRDYRFDPDVYEALKQYYRASTEYKNHASYIADETVEVNKYISENDKMFSLISRAYGGQKTLLIAPTGSGKTYSIINLLKRLNIKSIFVVPSAIQVEQIMNDKEISIPGAFDKISVKKVLEQGNTVAMTWDKFVQVDKETLSEYIVIVDEVHQTYTDMYRKNKINRLYENLTYVRGQIDVTATPNKLGFEDYEYILEYRQTKQTNYNVKLYSNVCADTVCNIVRASKKFALLKDDTDFLNLIKENIPNKKIDVVTSSTRNLSETYKEIVSNSTMRNVEGICNTSLLIAGVNIYDQDITDIIIVGEKDIATIKQYVARFRDLETVNIHIFNNYEGAGEIRVIEDAVRELFEEVNAKIEGFSEYSRFSKESYKSSFVSQCLNIKPISLEQRQEYYYNSDFQEYYISEPGVRNTCYEAYYNQASIESFKLLLEEYFEDIEIVDIKEANNEAVKLYKEIIKLEKEEIIEQLEPNKNILVGALDIVANKENPHIVMTPNELEERRKELLELHLDQYGQIKHIADILQRYSNYVLENNYPCEMAWKIAIRGDRARGNIFKKINGIIYRGVEAISNDYLSDNRLEDKLYRHIKNRFKPGLSYTKEHLERYCNEVNEVFPGINATVTSIGEIIKQTYSISEKRVFSCPGIDFIYIESICGHSNQDSKKRARIYTINDYLTVQDLAVELKLNDMDTKKLEQLIKIEIEIQNSKRMLLDYEVNEI